MKRHLICLALCAPSFACVNVHPPSNTPTPSLQQAAATRTLNVNASATVPVTPEFAKIDVQFSIKKESEAGARAALHQAIRTLSETLAKLGVAKEDIQFQGASVSQAYKRDPNTGATLPDGFAATKKTLVTLRTLKTLSDSLRQIIDASASVGSVSDVTLGTSKIEKFEDIARERATALLMKKAKSLALGTNATLDGVVSLSESTGGASSVVSKEVIYAQNTSSESLKLETQLSLRAVFALK